MTDYDQMIGRSDTPFLTVTQSKAIMEAAITQSAVLGLMRQLDPLPSKATSIPVLDLFPTAYFVSGEAGDGGGSSFARGLMKTTKEQWKNVTLTAEELAVVVPIPKSLIDDAASAGFDLYAMVKPRLEEAIARAVDAAVLHGANKPTTWPDGLVTQATAKSNVVALGTGNDIYDDIMGEGGVISLVEADGFEYTGAVGAISMKAKLRGLRGTTGEPLFNANMQNGTRYDLSGVPVNFPRNGSFDASAALLVAGDFSQAVWAYRQQIEYTISDSAVITDSNGAVILNTFQQNSLALRAVVRMGWALPNPKNLINSTDATRLPFAVLTP